MKRLLSILLAVAMLLAIAVPAMAAEEGEGPELYAEAYAMSYYEGGYGAGGTTYFCQIRDETGWYERYQLYYGDPLVEWPTEIGEYTVQFSKTVEVDGVLYTFPLSLDITVKELPATSGSCGDNMTWFFDTTNDTLTIEGSGDMYTIAETVDDYWNEQYGFRPTWWDLPVKHVVIGEGVETLSNFAFFDMEIETLELPTTLKALPQYGLITSFSIRELVIPEGITSLTGWPFGSPGNSFIGLTDIYLPSTLVEVDALTLLIAGLDSRTAQQTLQTIHYTGTEEDWANVQWVDSPNLRDIFGDDYEGFYENWCVPAKNMIAATELICTPKETPILVFDSAITMSELYATKMDGKLLYSDWFMYGKVSVTVMGEKFENIAVMDLKNYLVNVPGFDGGMDWVEVNNQFENQDGWTVGESNDALLLLYLNGEQVEIPCQVVIQPHNIVSVSSEPVSFYQYEGGRYPTLVATLNDGSKMDLSSYSGIDISYPNGYPTQPGTYTVDVLLGYVVEATVQVTVLANPTSGKLGDDITWTMDAATSTMTLSGTGCTYDEENGNWGDWVDLFMGLAPEHIVVEEGIEGLTAGIFHYGLSVKTLTLPTTLKSIPDALIGWNGLPYEELDGYKINTMSAIVIPEGITALTTSAFYNCLGISEFYLPSTLTELDLDTLCWVAVARQQAGLDPLDTTVYFAGTEAQWQQVQFVKGERIYSTELSDEELEAVFATFTLVFAPEKIEVEEGVATVPDSVVDVTEGEDVVIEIPQPDTEDETEVPVTSVVIGKETVDKIVDAEVSVEIQLPDMTVSFDKTAVESIGQQAGEESVTIVAKEVEDTQLNTQQQAALEEKEVVVYLSLEAHAGETKITEFSGGKVTVSVPFLLPENKSGEDFCVAYVADDGTVTIMPTTYADGQLTFETTHFSHYVVLDQSAETPDSGDTPETGDLTNPAMLVMLMLAAVAGLAVCEHKRRAF